MYLYSYSVLQTYVPSRSLCSASERCIILPSQRGTKSLSQTFSLNVPPGGMTCPTQSEQLNPLPETAKNTSLPSLLDPLTLVLYILIIFYLSVFFLLKINNKKTHTISCICIIELLAFLEKLTLAFFFLF